MNLLNLKRNDLEGALKFAEEAMKAGKYDGELEEILIMLQDDTETIIDELAELKKKRGLI